MIEGRQEFRTNANILCKGVVLGMAIAGMVLCSPAHSQTAVSTVDEAKDALDTLSFALQCPIKPDPSKGQFETSKFTGNRQLLQIDTKTFYADGTNVTRRIAAKFSELNATGIYLQRKKDEPNGVIFSCIGQKDCATEICVNVQCSPSKIGRDLSVVKICDEEVASYAKVAIDTLMGLSKESRPAEVRNTPSDTGVLAPGKPQTSGKPSGGTGFLLPTTPPSD